MLPSSTSFELTDKTLATTQELATAAVANVLSVAVSRQVGQLKKLADLLIVEHEQSGSTLQ